MKILKILILLPICLIILSMPVSWIITRYIIGDFVYMSVTPPYIVDNMEYKIYAYGRGPLNSRKPHKAYISFDIKSEDRDQYVYVEKLVATNKKDVEFTKIIDEEQRLKGENELLEIAFEGDDYVPSEFDLTKGPFYFHWFIYRIKYKYENQLSEVDAYRGRDVLRRLFELSAEEVGQLTPKNRKFWVRLHTSRMIDGQKKEEILEFMIKPKFDPDQHASPFYFILFILYLISPWD